VAIVFDPEKDRTNLAKHGVSLARADRFDFASAVVAIDDRKDYGEVRYRAFGRIGGLGFCLVFVILDEVTIRAISFRRARDKELKRHGL
jgi:uncharacterized DUF497 family protein